MVKSMQIKKVKLLSFSYKNGVGSFANHTDKCHIRLPAIRGLVQGQWPKLQSIGFGKDIIILVQNP